MSSRADDAFAAHATGLRGDLRPSTAWLAGADGDDPREAALRRALMAQRWLAGVDGGGLVAPKRLAALDDRGAAFALAVEEHGRAAVLVCDLPRLEGFAALGGPEALLHAWVALARGRFDDAGAMAGAHQGSERAPTRIEAACLRALAHVGLGQLDEARTLARRASRMARTEDMPQSQYLSNLVLARIRRLQGTPHFALRIVDALASVVSSPWHARVAWEGALGGAAPRLPHPEAQAWAALLGAAERGDAAAFDEAHEWLAGVASRWPPRAAELAAVVGVLDPRADTEAMPAPLRDFCEGRTHAIPPSVCGLCTAAEGAGSGVFVGVSPSGEARRVAGLAAPLARAALSVRHEPLKPGRTELAVAVLALAGPEGLPRGELFRRIYGFAFDLELHDGTFRTLLHRTRKWVEGRGEVQADGERIALRLDEPLLLADPRCEESLEDRMLRYLARAEHKSARDAAKELGVPLRTAQTALRSLTDSGAVEGRRVGRRIEYRVEDTTFSEPTRWR